MRYGEFAKIMTHARMSRYMLACNGNTRKAMTLYRKNLLLTQELFTIVACFEVALRNAIDAKLSQTLGKDWIRDSVSTNGIFNTPKCRFTQETILEDIQKLRVYNHNKLVAELGFGFWRFMFAQNQFNATGRILLSVFPSKPISNRVIQYNNTYIFNQLAQLNNIRNRMAHHEPICFLPGQAVKSSSYSRQHYHLLKELFQWMQMNESQLLFGLDHIYRICEEIDLL